MNDGIVFRPALPADAYALAELSILAGDGMYEFLLEEMAPREMLAGLMARNIKQDAGGFSWRHCFVADDKGVVGMINAFPAAWLREEERNILPQDRVQILDPIDQAQDWESFLINSVAVRPQHQRQGIGSRLMEMALDGKTGGFARVSCECVGRQCCRPCPFREPGFAVRTRVEVPPHPALTHVGGQLVDGAADRHCLIRDCGTDCFTSSETNYRHGRGIACFSMADKLLRMTFLRHGIWGSFQIALLSFGVLASGGGYPSQAQVSAAPSNVTPGARAAQWTRSRQPAGGGTLAAGAGYQWKSLSLRRPGEALASGPPAVGRQSG